MLYVKFKTASDFKSDGSNIREQNYINDMWIAGSVLWNWQIQKTLPSTKNVIIVLERYVTLLKRKCFKAWMLEQSSWK